MTTNPTYESLGFDPNGPKLWDVVKKHPIAAVPAGIAAGIARLPKPDNYEGNGRNDAADAYRHGLWNSWMSQTIGPKLAKEFADSYERWSVNPSDQRLMDLYKNKIGRERPSLWRNEIDETLKEGVLRTSPFKTR